MMVGWHPLLAQRSFCHKAGYLCRAPSYTRPVGGRMSWSWVRASEAVRRQAGALEPRRRAPMPALPLLL